MGFVSSKEQREEILLACRVLTHFHIVQGFGHVSTRMTTRVYRHQITLTITAGKAPMERLFTEDGGQHGGQAAQSDA